MTFDPVLSLQDLIFSAKIDYLSLSGLTRDSMPSTTGRAVWPRSMRNALLTIHDPTHSDVRAVAEANPSAKLMEMEVAVDVRLKERHSEEAAAHKLSHFKSEYVAKGLKPRFAEGLNSGFRGAYSHRDGGYVLMPFNRRVPGTREQLLYGHRNDGVQVKVYFKDRDNNRPLPFERHRIRMEVRLGATGLDAHNLCSISDLVGFEFRHNLMPYLQHVHGSRRSKAALTRNHRKLMLAVLSQKQDHIDAEYWATLGIGAFQMGGNRIANDLLFLRHALMNDRIGQSLHRLQKAYAHK